jgi:hypothetical protein
MTSEKCIRSLFDASSGPAVDDIVSLSNIRAAQKSFSTERLSQ